MLGLNDGLAEAFGKVLNTAPGAAAALTLGDLLGHAFGGTAAEGLGPVEKTGLVERLAGSVLDGWGRRAPPSC